MTAATTSLHEAAAAAPFDVLVSQIRRIWDTSPFYRSLWRNAGLVDGDVPTSVEDFASRWPTVDKRSVLDDQAAHPPHGTNLCVDPGALAQVHLTSNTSGVGRELYGLTPDDVDAMGASWTSQFDAIGLRAGDVAFAMLPISFMTAGLSAIEGIRRHQLVGIATGIADKEWIIDSMSRFGPALIYGTESFLLQLFSLLRTRDGRLPHRVAGVIVPGASIRLVELADELLGATVFEVYGCTQASTRIATTCSLGVQNGSLHVHSSNHLVEILRPGGTPAGPGETGEVVLTTLRRQASPSIRFRMNDRVRIANEGCPCGTPGLVLEPMSIGRIDDMVKVKGANIWPDAVHHAVMSVTEVAEYQVEIRRRPDGGEQLTLIVEPVRNPDEDLRRRIEHQVRAATYVRPVVEFRTGLPRHDYKARRWNDLRDSPGASWKAEEVEAS